MAARENNEVDPFDFRVDDLDSDHPWFRSDQSEQKDPNPMNYLKYIYKTYAPEKYEKMKKGFEAAGNPLEDEESDKVYEEWKRDYDASNEKMDESSTMSAASSSSNPIKSRSHGAHEEEDADTFEFFLPNNEEGASLEDVDVGDLPPMCKTDNFFEEVHVPEPSEQANSTYLPTLVEEAANMSIGEAENCDENNSVSHGMTPDEETKKGDKCSDIDSSDDEEEIDEEVHSAIYGPPSSIEFTLPLDSMGTYKEPPIRTDADAFLENYIEQEDAKKVDESDKPTVFYNDNFKKRNTEVVIETADDEDVDGGEDTLDVEEVEEPPSGYGNRFSAILEAMKNKSPSDSTDRSRQDEGRGERSFTTVEIIQEGEDALPSEV